jgi:hypothetical protein
MCTGKNVRAGGMSLPAGRVLAASACAAYIAGTTGKKKSSRQRRKQGIDLSEVREQVSMIVKAEAVEMTAVVDEGKESTTGAGEVSV